MQVELVKKEIVVFWHKSNRGSSQETNKVYTVLGRFTFRFNLLVHFMLLINSFFLLKTKMKQTTNRIHKIIYMEAVACHCHMTFRRISKLYGSFSSLVFLINTLTSHDTQNVVGNLSLSEM